MVVGGKDSTTMSKDPKAYNLTALYTELDQQGKNGEFDRGLKTANKILQAKSDDDRAFHCKIVCLIQLNKFSDALKHISQNPVMSKGLDFEKAYSLYRLNRTDEASEVLESVENPDPRVKELFAQVLYRKEKYHEALSVYKDLIKNTQDDYDEERTTNLTAVIAALQMWNGEDVDDFGVDEDSYELCYNAACGCIGHNNYQQALNKLKRAEVECRRLYEGDQDMTDEDIEVELGDIRVQMGYIYQKMGKNDEAMKQYNLVIKSRPTDITLAAVASNNIITINKDQNVFDSQKRIKALQADGLQQKLTRLQRQVLLLNQSLFYLLQNKGDLCKKVLQSLKKEVPDDDLAAVVEAALYTKEKQHVKAIEILRSEAEKSNTMRVRLAMAQLYLLQGDVYKACDELRALLDGSYRLGLVSALVVLYLSKEDMDAASDVLEEALAWYQQHKPNSRDIVILMRATANFQLQRGNAKGATTVLEQLRKQDPSDLKTLAQLISAYSKFDPQKAQLVSRELPLPTDLSKNIDIDSLELSANTLGPKYTKRTVKMEQSPVAGSPGSDTSLIQKKKKKKKKVKLPKDYDPNATPDVERWLPLRERSYYRGKRKKKTGVGKGTQGAVSASAAAELDKSIPSGQPTGTDKQPAAASPKSGSSGSTPVVGPRQQKPQTGRQARKKKKGGNKW